MHSRLKIVKYWFLGKRNGVSFQELVAYLFQRTCPSRAKSRIQSIEEADKYLILRFNNFDHPLYYPKEMNLRSLYVVITESLYANNWHYYQIEQTQVGPEDVVIDCGAAEGLFSLLTAGKCKKVYIIEPLPAFVELLKLTFYKMNNVEIIPVALSDKAGEAMLSNSGIESSLNSSGHGIPVKVATIDDLFLENASPVTYIKADIEGYELEMLKGASRVIKEYTPKIAITTYHKEEHAELISDYLKSINSRYHIKVKGIYPEHGGPVMLHAWID